MCLRERGVSVPGDLSVVGFDNQEVIAAHVRPPLSTGALPHGVLGAAGIRLLLGLDSPAESIVKVEWLPSNETRSPGRRPHPTRLLD